MPVVLLRSLMSKTEYFDWLRYYKYKSPDSLEIQLAMLTTLVSQGLGKKDSKVEDFIVHNEQRGDAADNAPHEMAMEDVASFFGMLSTPME